MFYIVEGEKMVRNPNACWHYYPTYGDLYRAYASNHDYLERCLVYEAKQKADEKLGEKFNLELFRELCSRTELTRRVIADVWLGIVPRYLPFVETAGQTLDLNVGLNEILNMDEEDLLDLLQEVEVFRAGLQNQSQEELVCI